jgi:DNA adenine methylase
MPTPELELPRAVPFLRWAGGKSKIARLLGEIVPPSTLYSRYIEPFLGSGAIFFHVRPSRALLADANTHLINCFAQVARDPRAVSHLLKGYLLRHSRDYYYHIRKLGLAEGTPIQRAARFIYINKAAFNGIFRVNRSGQFNVPFGPSQSGPAIPSEERLVAASRVLKRARLRAAPFEATCDSAGPGDFIYLDPPYPPLARSANFTHYTSDRFGMADQRRVADAFRELDSRGCLIMLSNADQPQIRDLYRGYCFTRLEVTRWLGSNGRRFRVHEIVVTNYDPPRKPVPRA